MITSALTAREKQIICAIKSGKHNRGIATHFSISEETVKRNLTNIYAKLGVSSRLELAVLASKRDLGVE